MPTTTYDALIARYSSLHESTRLGFAPDDLARACEVWSLLNPQLNPGDSVLDCSAGRGVLLRLLVPYGIKCTATEADPYLVTHDLAPYSPRFLRYAELDTLAPEQWDAVVSINVLQHLATEDEVTAALRIMAALARRWLCVCINMLPLSCVTADGEIQTLHQTVRGPDWWTQHVAHAAPDASIVRAYAHHEAQYILAAKEV